MIWAIVDVVLALVPLVGVLVDLPAIQQPVRELNAMPAGPAGVFLVVFIAGVCFAAAIGFAPPIFALVWFNRRKIKDEVAGWL